MFEILFFETQNTHLVNSGFLVNDFQKDEENLFYFWQINVQALARGIRKEASMFSKRCFKFFGLSSRVHCQTFSSFWKYAIKLPEKSLQISSLHVFRKIPSCSSRIVSWEKLPSSYWEIYMLWDKPPISILPLWFCWKSPHFC